MKKNIFYFLLFKETIMIIKETFSTGDKSMIHVDNFNKYLEKEEISLNNKIEKLDERLESLDKKKQYEYELNLERARNLNEFAKEINTIKFNKAFNNSMMRKSKSCYDYFTNNIQSTNNKIMNLQEKIKTSENAEKKEMYQIKVSELKENIKVYKKYELDFKTKFNNFSSEYKKYETALTKKFEHLDNYKKTIRKYDNEKTSKNKKNSSPKAKNSKNMS